MLRFILFSLKKKKEEGKKEAIIETCRAIGEQDAAESICCEDDGQTSIDQKLVLRTLSDKVKAIRVFLVLVFSVLCVCCAPIRWELLLAAGAHFAPSAYANTEQAGLRIRTASIHKLPLYLKRKKEVNLGRRRWSSPPPPLLPPPSSTVCHTTAFIAATVFPSSSSSSSPSRAHAYGEKRFSVLLLLLNLLLLLFLLSQLDICIRATGNLPAKKATEKE